MICCKKSGDNTWTVRVPARAPRAVNNTPVGDLLGIHQSHSSVVDRCRQTAEGSLELVGTQRQMGRHTCGQQRGQGDNPPTTCDGVHESGKQACNQEKKICCEGENLHWQSPYI